MKLILAIKIIRIVTIISLSALIATTIVFTLPQLIQSKEICNLNNESK